MYKINTHGRIYLMPWNAAHWNDLTLQEQDAIKDFFTLNGLTNPEDDTYVHLFLSIDAYNFSKIGENSWFVIDGDIIGRTPLRYSSSVINFPVSLIQEMTEGNAMEIILPLEVALKEDPANFTTGNIFCASVTVDQLGSQIANLGPFEEALKKLI